MHGLFGCFQEKVAQPVNLFKIKKGVLKINSKRLRERFVYLQEQGSMVIDPSKEINAFLLIVCCQMLSHKQIYNCTVLETCLEIKQEKVNDEYTPHVWMCHQSFMSWHLNFLMAYSLVRKKVKR